MGTRVGRSALALLVLSIGGPLVAKSAAPPISITDRGTLGGYLQKTVGARKDLGALPAGDSTGTLVNSLDQVVGQSGQSAFFYDTQMRDMGSLGGGLNVVLGLSDGSQAVGWSYTAAGLPHGYVWSKSLQINTAGQAGGEARLADGSLHAALWTTQYRTQERGKAGTITSFRLFLFPAAADCRGPGGP